jgi:hypothetical protein
MSGKTTRELARLAVLAIAAAWLLHPFATARMYGAGDALWYANMLADFVTQVRAGFFPVFAGQTEFAFNGAVFPLRVAPMYQHLAGFLDLVTLHSLGFFALQHLAVIVCGVAGIYACYLTLCRIAPGRRWHAAGFSVLYLACPGLLATIYTQDLYMTWMSVPLAPLAVYGIVRTFRKDDLASQIWLAAPLAALWWAHAPIALWFTFVAAASQLVRLAYARGAGGAFKRAALGAVVFLGLTQYIFVSVAEIRAPGGASASGGPLEHREKIAEFARGVFPGIFEPLSYRARELSDIQLGYGLWAVLACAALAASASRRRELRVLLAGAAVLLILLLPLPGINSFLWGLMPGAVVRVTHYWPMQRFYLILAALLAACGQIALDSLGAGRRAARVLSVVLLVGCAWSLWESRQFMRAAADRTASEDSTARSQRPENLMLMDHSYGLFPKMPAYFSNGVVDPRSQVRLKDPATGGLLALPKGTLAQSGVLDGAVDANPGILDLSPMIRLEPGVRYDLEITPAREGASGVLQFSGRTLFREYSLPSSGEPLAFGDGPASPHDVGIWTTDPSGDNVALRFIPLQPGAPPSAYEPFGSFALRRIDPAEDPVAVTSLVPLRATVRAGTPAILETPRMFMPGYLAAVDGAGVGVVRSAEGLAALPVPAGIHSVVLWFAGPPSLRVSYWLAVSAWAATLLAGAAHWLRPRN